MPPAGRPFWLPKNPAGWDLQFLSWGERRYGDQPIPVSMHEGWVYIVMTDGAPTAIVNNGARKQKTPVALIFHPDCAYGWTDRPGARSRLLCWVWNSPPAHSSLQPEKGGLLAIPLDRPAIRRLARLHAECVGAVATPGELASLQLRRARLDLDLLLARAGGAAARPDPDTRLALALRYLDHHPAELEPVARLCEYLQVSPGTLSALFRDRLGTGPRSYALKRRMEWARARLVAGALVKEVAAALGYRHPNDFSRAFARHFGTTAKASRNAIHPHRPTG